MKSAWCGFVLFAAGLAAQSTAKLDTDLAGLAKPNAPLAYIATQVTDDVLALAERDSQPSRQTALEFASELSKALAGKPSTQPKRQALCAAILEVLQSAGIPSNRFHTEVDHFRDTLIALNVSPLQAKSAANHLMILGQEVRGPEDIQLLRQFRGK